MVRKWEEESSYVGGDVRTVEVSLSVDGKKSQNVDIGDLIQEACELLIPKVGNAIKRIVAEASSGIPTCTAKQHHSRGGGSSSKDLLSELHGEQADIGDVNVWCVENLSKKLLKVHSCLPVKCLMTSTHQSTDLVGNIHHKISHLSP